MINYCLNISFFKNKKKHKKTLNILFCFFFKNIIKKWKEEQ